MVLSIRNISGIFWGVLMAATFRAEANSIVLTQNPFSYNIAGEFSAATTDDFVANYAPGAVVGGEFETFCVETEVIFNPGQPYTYVLSDQDSMGRTLSEGAAYLYYEFATGQLAGYNYNSPTVRLKGAGKLQLFPRQRLRPDVASSRLDDAGELQAAIWAFQGNQSLPGYPDLATDPFYQLAIDTLGADNVNSPANGQYGVDILQVWDDLVPGQNQLVYVGVIPDAASTGGLLLVAFVGLSLLSRRLTSNNPARRRPQSQS
jgi:hypothetical protein